MKTYTADEKLHLHLRSTRVIADHLALAHPYTRPPLRLCLAFDTAREILEQSDRESTLESLERNLGQLELARSTGNPRSDCRLYHLWYHFPTPN